jgi:hypothetical protein
MYKIVMGLIWSVVIYFGICMLIGGWIGAEIGGREPNQATANAKIKKTVEGVIRSNFSYIATAALGLGMLGSFGGVLPGTKD